MGEACMRFFSMRGSRRWLVHAQLVGRSKEEKSLASLGRWT